MYTDDLDVKIAGDKPSLDVKRNKNNPVQSVEVSAKQIDGAKAVGKTVAESFIADAETETDEEL